MKFRKPQHFGMIPHEMAALADFLRSLPAEFEILGPGEVAVKWPEDLTADYLRELADCVGMGTPRIGTFTALINLAAIAPERKKRMVELWIEKPNRGGLPIVRFAGETPHDNGLWCKVAGPIEIDY